MGWLGRLFGRREAWDDAGEDVDADPAESPPAVAPAEPPDLFDGLQELDREQRRPRLETFLRDLAGSLEGGDVVVRANDHTIDATGKLAGFPVRVQADETNNLPELRLELRLPDASYGDVAITCDPYVDQSREHVDAWSDTIRVFFGKSIFVSGPARGHDLTGRAAADVVRDEARRFAALPDATRERVLALLVEWTSFRIDGDAICMWMKRRASAPATKQTALDLLGAMVEVAGALPSVVTGAASSAIAQLVRCSYCQAEFFLDTHAACRHCGAPYR